MNTLQRAVVPAIAALRAYAGPAIWLTLGGSLALAIALPVIGGATALELPPMPSGDFGIEWTSLVVSPTVLQGRALSALSGLLIDLAVAVLIVAALVVAMLSLVRASTRQPELAIRRAVGASRRDLRLAAATEGVVLASLATVLGAPAGMVGAGLALASWPGTSTRAPVAAPLVAIAGLSGVVIAGALLSAFARRRVHAGAAPSPGHVVTAIQLGMALAVLVAAAQLDEAARSAVGTGSGTMPGDGQIFTVIAPGPRPIDRADQYDRLLHLLRDTHRLVSLTSAGTLAGFGTEDLILADCGRCSQGGLPLPIHNLTATIHAVSPDSFRALHLPVVAGRGFARTDDWGAPRVAVINQSLAGWHFQDGDAVGRKVFLGRNGWYTVIGVVRDREGMGVGAGLQSANTVYVSAFAQPPGQAELLVRGSADNETALVREAARLAFGPAPNVSPSRTEAAALAAEAAPVRWFAHLMKVEGIGALLIGALGSFAAMSLWVQRTLPELGARRAVGATRLDLLRFVLIRTLAVGLGGVLAGLWLGIVVSGLLSELVGSIADRTASDVVSPAVALLVAALLGALIPAFNAAGTTPVSLLEG